MRFLKTLETLAVFTTFIGVYAVIVRNMQMSSIAWNAAAVLLWFVVIMQSTVIKEREKKK